MRVARSLGSRGPGQSERTEKHIQLCTYSLWLTCHLRQSARPTPYPSGAPKTRRVAPHAVAPALLGRSWLSRARIWVCGLAGGVLMAGTSDLDRQIEQLRRCEYIKEAEVKALCAKAREILVEESNVQRVDAPVTVSAPRLAERSPAPPHRRQRHGEPLLGGAAAPLFFLRWRAWCLTGWGVVVRLLRSAATSTGSFTT